MKKIISLICLVLPIVEVFAQSSFVAAGGTAVGNNNGTVSYSVGQSAMQFISNNAINLSEGVQQPYEISTVGLSDYPSVILQALVYPNPTRFMVTLFISDYENISDKLIATIYDYNGKLIQNIPITESLINIPMETLSAATYFLKISEDKNILKIFKIVKIM